MSLFRRRPEPCQACGGRNGTRRDWPISRSVLLTPIIGVSTNTIIIMTMIIASEFSPGGGTHSYEVNMKVEGSIVLVTGANGGIGRALVSELLNRGAAKIYIGARDTASLQPLLAQSDKLVPVALDVTKPEQIATAAKIAADVTLLINNAGTAGFTGALSAKDLSNARQEMEVNYFGVLALTQALRDAPAFRNGGAIVNVLSFLALVTLPVAGTYSASKSAALALTRTLRAELKPRGVQVLGVLPVQVDTPLGAPLPEPKLTPADVATGTLDALEAGADEVFPGALSEGAAQAFRNDPAALQANLATAVHSID